MVLKNLDKLLLEETVADMVIGSKRWLVPWALIIERKTGDVFLQKDHGVSNSPGGTSEMEVVRLSKEDFEVDVSCIRRLSFMEDLIIPVDKKECFLVGNMMGACMQKHLEENR